MDFHIELGKRQYNLNFKRKKKGYITNLYQYSILSYIKSGFGGLKKTRVDRNFTCYVMIDTEKRLVEVIDIQDFENESKTKKDFDKLDLNFNEIKSRCQKMINYESDKIIEVIEILGNENE